MHLGSTTNIVLTLLFPAEKTSLTALLALQLLLLISLRVGHDLVASCADPALLELLPALAKLCPPATVINKTRYSGFAEPVEAPARSTKNCVLKFGGGADAT